MAGTFSVGESKTRPAFTTGVIALAAARLPVR